jgi:hypothetical protein
VNKCILCSFFSGKNLGIQIEEEYIKESMYMFTIKRRKDRHAMYGQLKIENLRRLMEVRRVSYLLFQKKIMIEADNKSYSMWICRLRLKIVHIELNICHCFWKNIIL